MEDRYSRCNRHPASCQILFQGRAAGLIMAIPFVLCFTLFGVFNLVGGTILTIMACKPKISKAGLELFQKLLRKTDIKFQQQLDPMQVVGIILLLTGCMLVFIGISLGVVACRSVHDDKRRRNRLEEVSMSGMPISTMAERSSRRTSSSSFSPYTPYRKNDRKKSFPSENIASPILEVDSEDDDEGWGNSRSNDEIIEVSPTELRSVTFRQNTCLKNRGEDCGRVGWASDSNIASNEIEVVAEILPPSPCFNNNSPKRLLTTDL